MCDAAGATSSTGRFASQLLAAKGFDSTQGQGAFGATPGPVSLGKDLFNPFSSEAERMGKAPASRAMEEAWRGGVAGRTPAAPWVEDFSRHHGGVAMGGKGKSVVQPRLGPGKGMNADPSPIPMHAEPFLCLNAPLRGFFRGDFVDAFTAAKDGNRAMAVEGLAQVLGVHGAGKLRRRADILARQIFAEREKVEPSHRTFSDQRSFVDKQVNELMLALRMEGAVMAHAPPTEQARRHLVGSDEGQALPWNQISQDLGARVQELHMRAANGVGPWSRQDFVSEPGRYNQKPCRVPQADATSYKNGQEEIKASSSARTSSEEAARIQEQGSQAQAENDAEQELLDHTRALEATMATSAEPKFRQSKFLDFVSKMNTGELKIVEEHLVEGEQERPQQRWDQEVRAEGGPEVGNVWASDFEKLGPQAGSTWAEDSAKEGGPSTLPEEWANEFADHYTRVSPSDGTGEQRNYQVSSSNPFETTENPFELGQDLYKNGLLSEAALAFEAAIGKEMHVAESWRMLGMVHAENDDDKQAIASMVNAHAADPTNLDILLDLGVSHTNELETHEALNYLRQWIGQHPEYKNAVALSSFQVNLEETIRMFDSIGQSNPRDPNVYTALGVLYNLSREYNKAEDAFKHALSLQQDSHSLWNKLGATQANSSNSKEAVEAYQQALNIKPNYVRSWSNMGIGFSNQGMYKESIPYYVRALSMNANAEPLWGYLKIAMACSGCLESLHLVNERNIGALAKAFPI